MSVLVPAILLAVAVVFFVLHPVAVGLEAPMDAGDDELLESQHRKKVTLLALRDVEYDFQSGKLDEGDYLQLKTELATEALEAIDKEEAEWRGKSVPAAGPPRSAGESERKRAEEAMEREIAALRTTIREGVVCAQCAHPNPRGSRFCADCGAALRGS